MTVMENDLLWGCLLGGAAIVLTVLSLVYWDEIFLINRYVVCLLIVVSILLSIRRFIIVYDRKNCKVKNNS